MRAEFKQDGINDNDLEMQKATHAFGLAIFGGSASGILGLSRILLFRFLFGTENRNE